MTQTQTSDRWERGDPYERYIGRWSRKIAPRFLAWLGCADGLRWLDVGCGTGALSAAVLEHCSPRMVTGVEPSAGFLKNARQTLAGRELFSQGTATALPFGADLFDRVISGLVLNFVTDQPAGLAEMARVTRSGGTIAAYVWDYAGKMEILRFFWEAAAELDPDAARLVEGYRFPICDPGALEALFTGAGLRAVETTGVEVPAIFTNYDDFWQPFLGGTGPAPAYVVALEERARTRLRERLFDRFQERGRVQPDGSVALVVRAWAVRGEVEK